MRDGRLPVAVIGGGLSGLVCAGQWIERGRSVEVFDKARGPGGRMATRRRDTSTFDHGAPFFSATRSD